MVNWIVKGCGAAACFLQAMNAYMYYKGYLESTILPFTEYPLFWLGVIVAWLFMGWLIVVRLK